MFDERLLSSGLITPKVSFRQRDPTILQAPLLDSPRMKRIAAAFEETSGRHTFADTVEVAVEVGNLVRHTLSFSSMSEAQLPPLDPAALHERPVTNCYGYTIVASECLDKLGVEHYIRFANQHAFVTIFKPGSNKAFMLSVADKELYLDITEVIGGAHPLDQLAVGELFAENTFDSEMLRDKIDDDDVRADLMNRRPWLHFATDHKHRYERLTQADFTPIMRTYPSYPGRGIVQHYFDSLSAAQAGRLDDAMTAIENLAGTYPDVDPRNTMLAPRLLKNQLARARRFGDMVTLARAIDASLGAARGTRSAFFLPDTLRSAAMQQADKGTDEEKRAALALVTEAITRYEAIDGGGTLRTAKIRRGEYLLSLLSERLSFSS